MKLKKFEGKLIHELMKNCRQSDRVLSKKIGVSQPTVTRIRSKLEREGIIKEYVMIPDFGKLGFDIMALTFIRYKKEMTPNEYKKVKEVAKEYEQKFLTPYLMALRGMGLGYDRVIATFHENYLSYTEMVAQLRQLPFMAITDIQSFLVDLNGTEHYQPFTLSKIAKYLLSKKYR